MTEIVLRCRLDPVRHVGRFPVGYRHPSTGQPIEDWFQARGQLCSQCYLTVQATPVVTPPAAASPVARRSDPQTSWEAARSVTPRVRKHQQEVLDLLHEYGPMHDEELAYRARAGGSSQSLSGLRTRRKELVDAGLVRDSGQKALTSCRKRTIVWELTCDAAAVAS